MNEVFGSAPLVLDVWLAAALAAALVSAVVLPVISLEKRVRRTLRKRELQNAY